jgi:hypothetical protein
MNANEYCTVLNVLNVISTDILGFTFWGTSVEFINQEDNVSAGIVYFIDKNEAMNFKIGNRFLR